MKTSPPFHYVILGAGRQGTAAAYDLARFGQAACITLADLNLEQAGQAADRVNRLTGKEIAQATALNVSDPQALSAVLQGADVVLSAVPYYHNLAITRAAIAAGASLCDMGGNTDVVWQQLALDAEAAAEGVSVVPDCGMGPGLINTLAAYAMELLDEPQHIYIYDGGLPQQPVPPWNYELTFHINGLTNEMDGQAVYIREGKVCRVETLTEPEMIEVPPFGTFEADVSSGGTSTAPWTFEGRLQTYENKVLRYQGHYEWLRAFKTLGLFSEAPIRLGGTGEAGQEIIPRQVYHALLEPKITRPDTRDICIMRVVGKGLKEGRPQTVTLDMVDRYDEATGFTGMERLTGWHCSIMMIFQALGQVRPGAVPMEIAVPASQFIAALEQRGIPTQVSWQ